MDKSAVIGVLCLLAVSQAPAAQAPSAVCPAPTSIPEWGEPVSVRDLDAERYGRRHNIRPLAVRESHWEIPPGTTRFTCVDLGDEKAARDFFNRQKVLIGPEQIVKRQGRFVILVYLPMEKFLREAAAKVEAEESYGPGKGLPELDLPDSVFPERGRLNRNPRESSVDQFENQEGGVPLTVVRHLMWQRGASMWLEAGFLYPPNTKLLPELLKASLSFRRKANGHVVAFVAPEFLVEVIGSDPKLVDETASRIEKLHPDWKKHSDTESAK